MKTFKPMLAATLEDLTAVRFPVLASPKLDGVRAIIRDGVVLSRSLKPIPNSYVQTMLGGQSKLEGLDGELIVGAANNQNVMQATMSGIMSKDGAPFFTYYVFDHIESSTVGFDRRLGQVERTAETCGLGAIVRAVPHRLVGTIAGLETFEAQTLDAGFEGVMLRDPLGLYKWGRSTLREGGLLKLKRFVDSEARIVDFEERLHNANEATTNELGHTQRSSHKANLIPMGTLGAFVCETDAGVRFNVGTGLNDAQRRQFWDARETLRGQLLTYKHFDYGVVDAPRLPVFRSIRDTRDLS